MNLAIRDSALGRLVRIAMVGKYTGLTDAYLSVLKAPDAHSATWNILKGADGVLVPGGFGDRCSREDSCSKTCSRKLCSFSWHLSGHANCSSSTVVLFLNYVMQTTQSLIQTQHTHMLFTYFYAGGFKNSHGREMRLGSRRTYFQVTDCKSAKLYGNAKFVDECHCHRYKVNPDMVAELEEAGLAFVGKDETGKRMEIIDVQFHPEFKSRPGKPSAPLLGLIATSCGQLDGLLGQDGRLLLPSNDYRNGNPMKTRNHIWKGSFYLSSCFDKL